MLAAAKGATFCFIHFLLFAVIDKDFVGKAVLWHFHWQSLLTSVIFFFFQMSDWACPSKAEFIILISHWFQDQKGQKPEGLTQPFVEIARLSSGSCSTLVVLAHVSRLS